MTEEKSRNLTRPEPQIFMTSVTTCWRILITLKILKILGTVHHISKSRNRKKYLLIKFNLKKKLLRHN